MEHKKVLNIAFKGGGYKGLAYLRIAKEIFNKNIIFNIFSGASAGGIMGSLIMSGKNHRDIKRILIDLKGDKYLAYSDNIKRAFVLFRPFMYIKMIVKLRKEFFNSCKQLLKLHFPTWESINVRCNKAYICFVDKKDVYRYCSRGFVRAIKKYGFKNIKENTKGLHPKYYLKNIKPMYLSDDGVYQYDYEKVKLEKISDDVIPPWKAILSTFSNPILPDVKLIINNKKIEAFDGGLIDNFAILPHVKDGEYISVMCEKEPDGYGPGIVNTSNFIYNMYKPDKVCICEPLKERDFFDFSDEAIEEEYSRKATNFFKE